MTNVMIGNELGVAASDQPNQTLLASIAGDGVADNTLSVTGLNLQGLQPGMTVDFRVRATGSATGGATNRLITYVDAVNALVGYSGADVDIADASFGIYPVGGYAISAGYHNINGGSSLSRGFTLEEVTDSVASMREFLFSIDATTYSAAQLNRMTSNDLMYACRMTYGGGKGIRSFGVTPKLNSLID